MIYQFSSEELKTVRNLLSDLEDYFYDEYEKVQDHKLLEMYNRIYRVKEDILS